ncbi:hypothetical protein CJF31_00010511 [Rutstroemia sp. NJR-2017a BVV2]|nr:hypothetical protein CJF31_00010511 [Rutstroemia sp. NJR-2017a BVV2]
MESGDNTTLEDHAETTQTMPKQEGWIADRLKPGHHKFKIGNDTWLLCKDPITEATCGTFSRARYNDLKTKEVPSKPFPDAIGLSKVEQEINFPVPGGKSILNQKNLLPAAVLRQRSLIYAEKDANLTTGYLAYLVIEKLPGICLEPAEFWGLNWDKSKRDKFRRVFMESARLLEKLGIVNKDRAMRNLLYHEYKDQNGKNGLVDIRNQIKRQSEFANDKIVISSTGNGGIIVPIRNLSTWGSCNLPTV